MVCEDTLPERSLPIAVWSRLLSTGYITAARLLHHYNSLEKAVSHYLSFGTQRGGQKTGTRLMVHARNCRQPFAVFRCFLLLFAAVWGAQLFFFAFFAVFLQFFAFLARAIKRVPLSALLTYRGGQNK